MSGVVYEASDSEESASAKQGKEQGEFGRGGQPLPVKTINPFFMEFVDNVTPSSSEYFWNFERYSPRSMWNKRDEQSARDWSTMYYQNAYNTALLNYQNEYNSPLQQMLRYQEAGLNPYLVGQDPGNMGSAPSAAAPRGSAAAADSPAQIANAITNGVNGVSNALKSAQQIYDYITYGRDISESNRDIAAMRSLIAEYDASAAQSKSWWDQYWNTGITNNEEATNLVKGSPRAAYMEASTERIDAQIGQLEALVNVLYPSQAASQEATAALNDYRKQVLAGQKDAILRINTGNDTADSILKMVCFWLLGK